MERVLDEMKVLNERMKRLKERRVVIEEEINDEQLQRANLEIKVNSVKQR